ncbi:biliverdin-producing heme oxygenase [Hymenobacter sp. HSC-4F20]|uniref:biliverdin-producing heme oxygenase n=1 Tax=Hymenobacter sp. HSC-4F20 TaxID=2864135 RepID=UPI001C72AB63|nr:biliverdin-producing heme oxygenase [Hymenobacter sp. HSC-4F20]MBX0289627.1 biliverdin-producing heme oxygenase [Hymenobacter sp. HSC-4F20]
MLPAASPILSLLRHATQPYHAALEQNEFNRQLLAGTVSAAATEHFLGKLYTFLRPYEAALDQQFFSADWEIEARHRAHLIAQDLPGVGALPDCPRMPPLRTRAQVLGAMYVLEGSTLGGQLISRQLAKAGSTLRTYFTGYGEQTGSRWKRFCLLLAAEAEEEPPQAEIVGSAILTFQHLHAWIEQP